MQVISKALQVYTAILCVSSLNGAYSQTCFTGNTDDAVYSCTGGEYSDDWSAAFVAAFPGGGCPLPENPTPQEQQDWFNCRKSYWRAEINSTWATGDIIFIGDSLTDYAKAKFDPLLPGTHNFGLNGAHIESMEPVLDFIDDELSTRPPSQLYVLIGANNIGSNLLANNVGFDATIKAKYQSLFSRLVTFRNAHNNCEIIVRAIPAVDFGDPAVSNEAIMLANEYLETECKKSAYNFRYIDDHKHFYNSEEARSYQPHRLIGDGIHLDCSGYKMWLRELASDLYPSISNGASGYTISLDSSPASKPRSQQTLPTGLTYYRYAYTVVGPYQKLRVRSASSPNNYAGIFDPGRPSPYAASECFKADGTQAEANFDNNTDKPTTVVVCLGSNLVISGFMNVSYPGTYSIDTVPLNTASYQLKTMSLGQTLEGALTFNAPGGIWFISTVPQSGTKVVAALNDTVSQNASVGIYTYGGWPPSLQQQTLQSRSAVSSADLTASYITTSNNQPVAFFVDAKDDVPLMQRFSVTVSAQGTENALDSNSTRDFMPSVASDSGNNMVAVWYYEPTAGSSYPQLRFARSTNGGATWSSASTIYSSVSEPIRSGALAHQPTITSGNGRYAVIFPTASKIKVAELSSINGSWSITDVPKIGSTIGQDDYLPHITFRQFPWNGEWITSWMTRGASSGSNSMYMDLGIGYKTVPGTTWYSFDANATVDSEKAHVMSPMTAACIESTLPTNAHASISTWLEQKTRDSDPSGHNPFASTLVAGNFINVLKNFYEIKNPQAAWIPSNSVPNTASGWVLTWSMKNVPAFGDDLDIFYSVAGPAADDWTVPKPLNANAAYDADDDILGQVASDRDLGVRAIWESKRASGGSDVYVSDFSNTTNTNPKGTWTFPKRISENPGAAKATTPRTAANATQWVHIYESRTASDSEVYVVK